MASFHRVARAAKQIVKARKPQSCALFSSQILRFSSRCPAFCSCVPVLCSGGLPFYFRWSGILPLVSHHSAPGCPQFYFPVSRNSTSAAQDSAPTAHSISPKGHSPLPDSAFQFPTFSITLPKPTITTSRPTSHVTRAQKPRFCARNARKRGFQTLKAHKNPDFVLEKPENKGSKPQKRTKTSILCSKCPKTRVPNPKSAQKPQFCARGDWDWHREER